MLHIAALAFHFKSMNFVEPIDLSASKQTFRLSIVLPSSVSFLQIMNEISDTVVRSNASDHTPNRQ